MIFLFYFIEINIAYQKLVKTLSFAFFGTEFVKVLQMGLETTLPIDCYPVSTSETRVHRSGVQMLIVM